MPGNITIKVFPGCDGAPATMVLASVAEPNGGDHIATIAWNSAYTRYLNIQLEYSPGNWIAAPSSFVFTSAAETYVLRINSEFLPENVGELAFPYEVIALYAPNWAKVTGVITGALDNTSCKTVTAYRDECTNITKENQIVVVHCENPTQVESVKIKFAEYSDPVTLNKVVIAGNDHKACWLTSGDEKIPDAFTNSAQDGDWIADIQATWVTYQYAVIKYFGFSAVNDYSYDFVVKPYRIRRYATVSLLGSQCPDLPSTVTSNTTVTNARSLASITASSQITTCSPKVYTKSIPSGGLVQFISFTHTGFSSVTMTGLRYYNRRNVQFDFNITAIAGPGTINVSGHFYYNLCHESVDVLINATVTLQDPPDADTCGTVTTVVAKDAFYDLGMANGFRLRARINATGTLSGRSGATCYTTCPDASTSTGTYHQIFGTINFSLVGPP